MAFRNLALAAATMICAQFGSPPAIAQVAVFDAKLIVDECLQQKCEVAIGNLVASSQFLRLGDQERNSQLGLLAALLLDAAKNAAPSALADISNALAFLASVSNDAAQAEAIQLVSHAVSNGQAGLFDTVSPFAVSPN